MNSRASELKYIQFTNITVEIIIIILTYSFPLIYLLNNFYCIFKKIIFHILNTILTQFGFLSHLISIQLINNVLFF